jgi:hypothetical protein
MPHPHWSAPKANSRLNRYTLLHVVPQLEKPLLKTLENNQVVAAPS